MWERSQMAKTIFSTYQLINLQTLHRNIKYRIQEHEHSLPISCIN